MRSQAGVLLVTLLVIGLASCQGSPQNGGLTTNREAVVQTTTPPTTSPETPLPTESADVPESAAESAFAATAEVAESEMVEIVSVTELFRIHAPSGWQNEEAVPGAAMILANTEQAMQRYSSGSTVEPGDVVLNIGFLPLALLQDDQLAHYDFQVEASPEVFLHSLLPMFRVGDNPADSVVPDPVLVSVGEGRDAGMVVLSDQGSEGMVLVFAAGNGVVGFVSAVGFSGEMDAYRPTIYAVATKVDFIGAQDALYGALYGG